MPSRRRFAFSLLELITVVAIVMTLTALAIPSVYDMQRRATLAEVPVLLEGLFAAQGMYYQEVGTFVTKEGPYPAGPPTRGLRPWPAGTDWESELGWRPDGAVRGVYQETTACCTRHTNLYLYAWTDVDGDGELAEFQATWRTAAPLIYNQPWQRTAKDVY